MTKDEWADVLAAALDRHKEHTSLPFKVDRGEWSDGTPWLIIDIPGRESLRIVVEEA